MPILNIGIGFATVPFVYDRNVIRLLHNVTVVTTNTSVSSPCNSNGPLVHLLDNEIVTCYREQAVKDWETFLLRRTKELVPGKKNNFCFIFHTLLPLRLLTFDTIFTPMPCKAYLRQRTGS